VLARVWTVKRAALLGLFLAGCAHAYRPPTTAEPHALVKVRRVYERRAGTTIREAALVDEDTAWTHDFRSSVRVHRKSTRCSCVHGRCTSPS
jgi:hypothetical protein